jgi:glycosyltransferase involved in cell wall biosynthesis
VRIALVGPAHPYKGGVAAHTTSVASALRSAGHDVELVSWSRLYPERLYPGELAVPPGEPDVPVFEPTIRPLRWDRPGSWWRTGAGLRQVDLVVLVVVVPAQVPALLAVARSVRHTSRGSLVPGTFGGPLGGTGDGRAALRSFRPAVAAIVHNVVPHETHPGGAWLVERMLRSMDAVLVHSPEQARLAAEHGARRVETAALPAHLPGGVPAVEGRELAARRPVRQPGEPLRVLTLGMVRDYKGYDLLLEAARDVPGVHVTIAGEQWGDAGERVRQLAADPALAGRVELLPGYVPGSAVPGLLAAHDVLALPYRHGTASQNVLLAHAHGLPVLASAAGTFAAEVQDGVDGLLVPPGDVAELTAALTRLAGPGELERLRAGLPELDLDQRWTAYVQALVRLAEPTLAVGGGGR